MESSYVLEIVFSNLFNFGKYSINSYVASNTLIIINVQVLSILACQLLSSELWDMDTSGGR